MQFSTLAIIAAAVVGVTARNQACGHTLVNSGRLNQADIAWVACGRTDTCDGREWNTLFAYNAIADPSQPLIKALRFCDKGCYEVPNNHDQCH
ncbi:hypothetical protein MAPG_04441 [Magnaporthiopsis poae ATCC 64411]|uniref:Uncharacterized protein n=1 Tax=Magnaporthiopsis poae (strain ATCC 64411 / 73-15) TaxID=644358 RepID=A0A0C4DWR1_MAGP6|nr:hypothetical protein MAPG_04441 [Magnaporthiopsis poae ATCC 64411]